MIRPRKTWILLLLVAFAAAGARAADWPQLGQNPQRWNYSTEVVEPPYDIGWQVTLTSIEPKQAHTVFDSTQAVIGGGGVYVGAKSGKLFAFDAADGDALWSYQTGGPILHTAGYAGSKVFVGSMDGSVYAVSASTGQLVWKFTSGRRYGFSTAVLLAEGNVYIADRGGYLYALAQTDGQPVWTRPYDANAPVVMSAAYNNGKVYFGSEDMRMHAVDADDGSQVWRTNQFPGRSFRNYWPIIFHGYVIFRCANTEPGPGDSTVDDYDLKNMFAINESNGQESISLPHYYYSMHGPTAPPAVTSDELLVVQWKRVETDEFHSQGWALLDIDTQTIDSNLVHVGTSPYGWVEPEQLGLGAKDEVLIPSVAGNCVFSMHNQGFSGNPPHQGGTFNRTEQKWYCYGDCPQPSFEGGRGENDQGGGCNAVSAANGRLYHVTENIVVCYVEE